MTRTFTFSVLLPVYNEQQMKVHGDFYFGLSLAHALKHLGHKTRLLAGEHWNHTEADNVALWTCHGFGFAGQSCAIVYTYDDENTFKVQAELALGETEERRQERFVFANEMRALHSFD